ncbi:cation diffusion facilitator family transporter [Roseicitreum antarcticum]|uniref:cation diffusion facilitator family transporter n=1 Tax=Roseicitreum antarcticum TaxID=564137 RepID=UPI000B85EAA3|nr:cation diffusion facilitator family transporter [Roseicitreum antarcticum]
MNPALKLAIGSLIVGAAVLGLKTLAWWLTGSIALLSDALESIVNVVTALAALIAVRLAAKPPDAGHPYGHHKAEFFSATLSGLLIILAALVILREAYVGLMTSHSLAAPVLGLAVNGAASVLNAVWAWVLITRGRALLSPALAADGRHLMTDVITSGGVMVGLVLALMTGWWFLDPLMAGLLALHIMWSGGRVVQGALSALMDEALPEDTLDTIREVIATHATGAVQAHDLRTRHAGSVTFIDFHLVVPGDTRVDDAHEVCDRVEAALIGAIPQAIITIHVEPDHKAKPQGIDVAPA